ncbi:MAG: diaminopimelate decarboxylase [Candidatus Hydrogenedentota bacterium]
MDRIMYKDDLLYCEGVSVEEIVKKVGTPLYIYSANTILDHYRKFDAAFEKVEHLICYSVKVNSNIAIIKLLSDEGSGFDIVSGGELYRVIEACSDTSKVVYAGVGKTDDEITMALKNNIMLFNIESFTEAERINEIAKKMGRVANIAVRINPDVEAKTHKFIITGTKENKFGLPIDKAFEIFAFLKDLKALNVVGIHSHIGSQLVSVEPYIKAVSKLNKLINNLRTNGFKIEILNIGGGYGIIYKDENPPTPFELSNAILPLIKDLNLKLLMEPGRLIVGNSGILVTKVLYYKESYSKNFVIVDAGMNDLIRPAFYEAYHRVEYIRKRSDTELKKVDIVGPVCESADFFAQDYEMNIPLSGDLLAIRSAGAYGFSMASNYNSRPRCAEVLVDGKDFRIIRKRESYRDIIRGESL